LIEAENRRYLAGSYVVARPEVEAIFWDVEMVSML